MKILRTASLGSNFTGSYKKSVRDLQLRGPFSSVAHLTLSVLYFFIDDIVSKVAHLLPSSIILKIFYKPLTRKLSNGNLF